MPRIDQFRRSAPGVRVSQREIPQGFFTDDVRAEAAAASQRARTAAGEAQAASGVAQALGQAGRLADNLGNIVARLVEQNRKNIEDRARLKFLVGESTSVREFLAPKLKDAYKDKVLQYAPDYQKRISELKTVFDSEVKDLPAATRDRLNAELKLNSTRQNLRINISQAQMVQDIGGAQNYEARQWELTKLRNGEQDLEATEANLKTQIEFGKQQGFLPNNPTTARALKIDLAAARRIAEQNKVDNSAAIAAAVANSLNASNLSHADKLDSIAKNKDLTGPEKRDATSQVNLVESARLARRQAAAIQERATLYDRINDKQSPLTRPEIEAMENLDQREQQQFWDWSQDIAAARAKGKLSRFEKSDPIVSRQVRRIVDTDPNAITTEQIHDLVGNGLSISDARQIIGDHDRRTAPNATPIPEVVRRSRAAIRSIFGARTSQITAGSAKVGDALKVQTQQLTQEAIKELRAINDYNAWAADPKNENATDAEHEQKVVSLGAIESKEVVVGFVDNIWFGPDPKEQVQFKIKVLQTNGIWGNWNPRQQAQAQDLFERGRGVNDTVRRVSATTTRELATQKTKKIVTPAPPPTQPSPKIKPKKPTAADPAGLR